MIQLTTPVVVLLLALRSLLLASWTAIFAAAVPTAAPKAADTAVAAVPDWISDQLYGSISNRPPGLLWHSPEDMMGVLNKASSGFRATSWNAALLAEKLPVLRVAGAWRSSRPTRPGSGSSNNGTSGGSTSTRGGSSTHSGRRGSGLTVVTQLSVGRLDQLRRMCCSWGGAVSAVVHTVVVQPLQATGPVEALQHGVAGLSKENAGRVRQLAKALEALHYQLQHDPLATCQLDLMLVWEAAEDARSAKLYPNNMLRNLAFVQVRTRLVAVVDVDFLLSRTLTHELVMTAGIGTAPFSSSSGRLNMYHGLCRNRTLAVLPAFEVVSSNDQQASSLTQELVDSTKDRLKQQYEASTLRQFAGRVFPKGHAPTNYTKWLNGSGALSYEVAWQEGYEPFFMTCTPNFLWYDARFSGYGSNKIVVPMAYASAGFTYVVHPNAWLLHYPHALSKSNKVFNREIANMDAAQRLQPRQRAFEALPANSLFRTMAERRAMVARQLRNGTYRSAVDPGLLQALRDAAAQQHGP